MATVDPGQPTPARRGRGWVKWVAIGCGGLLLLCIGLGVLAAIVSAVQGGTSARSATPSPAATVAVAVVATETEPVATQSPASATPAPPTATVAPPTATPVPATATTAPPTPTTIPATPTVVESTETAEPVTATTRPTEPPVVASVGGEGSPEHLLAQIQRVGTRPNHALVAEFAQELDELESKCEEDRMQLADLTAGTYKVLRDAGIREQPMVIVQGVNEAASALPNEASCQDLFVAWAIIRRAEG